MNLSTNSVNRQPSVWSSLGPAAERSVDKDQSELRPSHAQPGGTVHRKGIDPQILLDRKLQDASVRLNSDESIALLSECIRMGEIEAQNAVGKELIVFIGNTQAGKSTFVNYLYGCEMEGKRAKDLGISGLAGRLVVVKPTSQLKEIMPIGHSKKSMTFMPKIATDQNGFTYCDCPGFLDNRGAEINIANAVNIKNAFIKASRIKVVILINYHSLQSDRAKGLSDMIRICADLFGSKENLIHYKDSILLGISQLPAATEDEEGEDLEDLKKWVSETHLTDPFEVETLKFLSQRLFIYDPLNRTNLIYNGVWTREKVLKEINGLNAIEEPIKIFKTVLNAEDERGMRQISDEIKSKIVAELALPVLAAQNYQSIAGYHKSLNNLEVIENPYVLKLIGDAKAVITAHFNKKVSQFRVCCANGSATHQQEAEAILQELKSGVSFFEQGVQAEVNIPSLEKLLNALIKKKEAEAAALELQDLEKKFRDCCAQQDFVQAKLLLGSIEEKISFFDRQYHETNIPHRIKQNELNNLYGTAKRKYDETVKKQKEQKKELKKLEQQREDQQRQIEEQRKKEVELQQENERQKEITRQAEESRLKQERKLEKLKRREAELQEENAKQREMTRKAEEERAANVQTSNANANALRNMEREFELKQQAFQATKSRVSKLTHAQLTDEILSTCEKVFNLQRQKADYFQPEFKQCANSLAACYHEWAARCERGNFFKNDCGGVYKVDKSMKDRESASKIIAAVQREYVKTVFRNAIQDQEKLGKLIGVVDTMFTSFFADPDLESLFVKFLK